MQALGMNRILKNTESIVSETEDVLGGTWALRTRLSRSLGDTIDKRRV